MSTDHAADFQDRLRADLKVAMKARDRDAVTALRTLIGAVDNAQAVAAPESAASATSGPVAGASAGVGSTEVARRALTTAELEAIARAEIDEREASVAVYLEHGQAGEAERLQREAAALRPYLDIG